MMTQIPIGPNVLTQRGRVMQICISKLTIIDSDNGLSPGRHQAIIWTNAGILLTGLGGTNFSEILIKIYIVSFKKIHLKLSSGNWGPFGLSLNVLNHQGQVMHICINHSSTSTDNGLVPNQHKAIIWTNAGIFANWAPRRKFQLASENNNFNSGKYIWKCCLWNSGQKSGWSSAPVIAVLYIISWYTGLCYNSNWLYIMAVPSYQ